MRILSLPFEGSHLKLLVNIDFFQNAGSGTGVAIFYFTGLPLRKGRVILGAKSAWPDFLARLCSALEETQKVTCGELLAARAF